MINFNTKEQENIITLLSCIVFIFIYSYLDKDSRINLATLLTKDSTLFVSIIIISIISYYNIITGFVLIIVYVIMLLPYFKNGNSTTTEGFKSDSDLLETLKGNGSKTRKLLDKIERYETSKKRSKSYKNLSKDDTDNGEDSNEENFGNGDGSLKLKIRTFNPNDETDNNLLMTKEICDDIKKRIVYEYESIPYLKKYISSKLQEIIDLLELTED